MSKNSYKKFFSDAQIYKAGFVGFETSRKPIKRNIWEKKFPTWPVHRLTYDINQYSGSLLYSIYIIMNTESLLVW